MKRGIWVGKILMMVVIGIAIAIGFAIGTMYLWNWLVPALFAGPVTTFSKTAKEYFTQCKQRHCLPKGYHRAGKQCRHKPVP